ncbi:AAA family ATPase [Nitratifractor sp.]
MKASEIQASLRHLIRQKLPAFVWGPPGIGKSSIVRELAEEEGLDFLDLRLSLLDPTDLKGVPFFDPERRQGIWAAPSFLPSDPDSRGILFLDEINTAPPAVQASAYQLILDRRVGEYELPAGWSIVAAGNRESDRGVVYRMPPPLANRFVHFEMEVDLEDWKAWAYGTGIDPLIVAFLSATPEALFDFDPASGAKSFPTPRSWSFVDRILKGGLPEELLLDAVAGAVGRERALDFLSFRQVAGRLPELDTFLDGEERVEEDPRLLQVLVAMLVSRAASAPEDEELAGRILRASFRLPGEFAVMLVRELQARGVALEESEAWGEWVERFAWLLEG